MDPDEFGAGVIGSIGGVVELLIHTREQLSLETEFPDTRAGIIASARVEAYFLVKQYEFGLNTAPRTEGTVGASGEEAVDQIILGVASSRIEAIVIQGANSDLASRSLRTLSEPERDSIHHIVTLPDVVDPELIAYVPSEFIDPNTDGIAGPLDPYDFPTQISSEQSAIRSGFSLHGESEFAGAPTANGIFQGVINFIHEFDLLPPVALDLDGDGLEFVSLDLSSAFFDYDNDGYLENVGWLSGDDGFLITDLDGDGSVSSPEELVIAAQTADEADTDMEALAALHDSNSDGVLDANDSSWSMLKVWRDLDQDGVSDAGEIGLLADYGINQIGLTRDLTTEEEQDIEGNILSATANFDRIDGTSGIVGDVALRASAVGVSIDQTNGGVELHLEDDDRPILFATEEVPLLTLDAHISGYAGLFGGDLNDELVSSAGFTAVEAGTADFIADGGAGADLLVGGAGNDWLAGGTGIDTISGGAGHDILFFDGEDASILGGDGFDVAIGGGTLDLTLSLVDSEIEAAFGADGDDFFSGIATTQNSENADSLENSLILDGRAGSDTLIGGGGDDIIAGGAGADTLEGGAGDDLLIVDQLDSFDGGGGIDTLWVGSDEGVTLNITDYGIEIFQGGNGDDVVETELNRTTALFGGAGNDTLTGGWGDDNLSGETGNDRLEGGYGDDTYHFNRGDGADVIHDSYIHELEQAARINGILRLPGHLVAYDAGEADVLRLGAGIALSDLVLSQSGTDLIIALKDPDAPDANFEDLTDRVTLQSWSNNNNRIERLEMENGTSVDLSVLVSDFSIGDAPVALDGAMAAFYTDENGNPAAAGTVQAGTAGDDRLGDGDGDSVLIGQDGDDQLYGSLGADVMVGGAGRDVVDYRLATRGVEIDLTVGTGADAAVYDENGDLDTDAEAGIAGGDTFLEVEDVLGSLHDDVLTGDAESNLLVGYAGSDRISGAAGDDTLDGGDGDDTLIGGAGADTLIGGEGFDIASYEDSTAGLTIDLSGIVATTGDAVGDTFEGIEGIAGSAYDDVLVGDSADNTLEGRDGNDGLTGGAGADRLSGGAGTDLLSGGIGDDTYVFTVGDGHDTVEDGDVSLEEVETTETYTYQTTERIQIGTGEDAYWSTQQVSRQGTRTVITYQEVVGDAGDDTLLLDGDITPHDIFIRLVGNDMEIALKISAQPELTFDELPDRIALSGWQDPNQRIETIQFGNGTTLPLSDVVTTFGIVVDGDPLDLGQAMTDLAESDPDDPILVGTEGDDSLVGGDGDDTLIGGDGNDTLVGNDGDDTLQGDAGDDTLDGGSGADHLDGGEGTDTAVYTDSDPGVVVTLGEPSQAGSGSEGDAEGDVLYDVENVHGSEFDDSITGNSVDNVLIGNGGDDTLSGGGGADTLDGGEGNDTSDYSSDTVGVTVDLSSGAASGGDASGDILTYIENVIGGSGDDILTGTEDQNELSGGDGADAIIGLAGRDTIHGGTGADFMSGGGGDDLYVFSLGDGIETIVDEEIGTVTGTEIEEYTTATTTSTWVSTGEDTGYHQYNTVYHTATREITVEYQDVVEGGSDTLNFGEGISADDLMVERSGDDLHVGLKDGSNPSAQFTDLVDRIVLTNWFDSRQRIEAFQFADGSRKSVREIMGYFATDTDDTLTWTETAFYVDGGLGDDTLTGGEYFDRLLGGNGADTLLGAAGDDALLGGDGDDSLSGGDGGDFLHGGAGVDTLSGGEGANIFWFGTGDGLDTAIHEGSDTGTVIFDFSNASDIEFRQSGDDLHATLSPTDVLTITGWFGATAPALDYYLADGSAFEMRVTHDATTGNDDITGTYSGDLILAGDGDDTVSGGDGNDLLEGGAGNDIVLGGAGNDQLSGGAGNDTLVGGDGEDIFRFGIGDGLDLIQDTGVDRGIVVLDGVAPADIVFTKNLEDLVVTLDGTDSLRVEGWFSATPPDLDFQIDGGETVQVVISENGSALDDQFSGNDEDDLYYALGGADTISGGAGRDQLFGEAGNDTIAGEDGDDVLSGGAGDDLITGGTGNDTLIGGTGTDVMKGDIGDDTYSFSRGDGSTTILDKSDEVYTYTVEEAYTDTRTVYQTVTNGETSQVQAIQQSFTAYHDVEYTGTLAVDAGNDTLALGDGISLRDLLVRLVGNDLEIGIRGAGSNTTDMSTISDVITVQSWTDSKSKVESISEAGQDSVDFIGLLDQFGNLQDGVTYEVASLLNAAPVAVLDTSTTTEDQSVTLTPASLLTNDTDLEGGSLTLSGVETAVDGAAVVDGSGNIVFTPDQDFFGDAEIIYRVTDDGGETALGTVVVTVSPEDDAPIAVDDTIAASEDTDVTISVATLLGNDIETDGDSLTLTSVTGATNGSATLNGNDEVVFSADSNFSGDASFSYTVTDGISTDDGIVTVSVTEVNDAPEVTGDLSFVSVADTAITLTSADLLANVQDIDNDTLSIESLSVGSGTLSPVDADTWVIQPNAGFTGDVSISFNVTDGQSATASAATLTVSPPSDPPVAGADSETTTEDTTTTIAASAILSNDTDPEGDSIFISGVSSVSNGAASLDQNGDIIFSPDDDFFGDAEIVYEVSDVNGASSHGTITVSISPTADAPIGMDDSLSGVEDVALTISSSELTSNDVDVDGDALTVSSVSDAVNGTVSLDGNGNAVFTPDSNFNGDAFFTYTVSDGGFIDTAVAMISLAEGNDAPIAVSDQFLGMEDQSQTISAASLIENDTDIDGDSLSISAVSGASNGAVSLDSNGNVVFTPDSEFSGEATFTYTVSDGDLGSQTTATISVSEANDAPVAHSDVVTAIEEASSTISVSTLLSNDTDIDGDSVSFSSISGAEHGTAALDANGDIVFTPDTDFFGNASIFYEIKDEHGVFDVGTVTVTVANVNDAPVLSDDLLIGTEDVVQTISASELLVNDVDVDNDLLALTSVSNATNGSVSLDGNGDIVFTPNANFSGTATFTYIASDGTLSDEGVATVSVSSVNDAPSISSVISLSGTEDVALTITSAELLASASDVEGEPLTLSNLSADQGVLTGNGDGTWLLTPNGDFVGDINLNFDVSDGIDSVGGSAVVSFTDVNDAPVAADGRIAMASGGVASGVFAASDVDASDSITFSLAGDTDADGTLVLTGGGTVTLDDASTGAYTFDGTNASGADSFQLTATDTSGLSATGTIDVAVGSSTAAYASVSLDGDDHLSRTNGSAGNRKTWTLSFWVKRSAGDMGGGQVLFSAGSSSEMKLEFEANDTLTFVDDGASFNVRSQTQFNIADKWYHVTAVLDTTAANSSDRAQIWIDGSRDNLDLGSAGEASQNGETYWNDASEMNIGRRVRTGGAYFKGEMADIQFVDGAALAGTSFGEDQNGTWSPVDYTGALGTNGFHLGFASSSNLGADADGTNSYTSHGTPVHASAGGPMTVAPADLSSTDGNDIITGGAEAETISGGLGDDVISGGGGDDTFRFAIGDGADTIAGDGMDAGSTDTLAFEGALTRDDLWISQSGDNLRIDLLGSEDNVTLAGWFSTGTTPDDRIDRIEAGGEVLTEANVQQLVNAMASWSAGNSGQDGDDLASMPEEQNLTDTIAAAWQTVS